LRVYSIINLFGLEYINKPHSLNTEMYPTTLSKPKLQVRFFFYLLLASAYLPLIAL